MKALPLALALPLHLRRGPGGRTFPLAALAEMFLGKWNAFSSGGGGGVYLPASSTEKPAPHAARGNVLPLGPWQSSIKKLGIGKFENLLDS